MNILVLLFAFICQTRPRFHSSTFCILVLIALDNVGNANRKDIHFNRLHIFCVIQFMTLQEQKSIQHSLNHILQY